MPTPMPFFLRTFQTTSRTSDRSFTNLLADADNPPPVQVSSISDKEGIRLADGLVLSAASIFLEGQVYLWDVPSPKTGEGDRTEKDQWKGWTEDHFELFDVVVPKPEILLLGTGKRIVQPPPFIRTYLNSRGIQLDVMDTRNACATYNLLAEEGRRVAAALLPNDPSKGGTRKLQSRRRHFSDGRLKYGQGGEIYFECCLLK